MKIRKVCLVLVAPFLFKGCHLQADSIGGWDKKNEPATTVELSPVSKTLRVKVAANTTADAEGEITKKGDDLHAKFKGHFEANPAETMRGQGERAAMIAPLMEIQRAVWDDAEKNFGQNIALMMAAAGENAPKLAGAYADFLNARSAALGAKTDTGSPSMMNRLERLEAMLNSLSETVWNPPPPNP